MKLAYGTYPKLYPFSKDITWLLKKLEKFFRKRSAEARFCTAEMGEKYRSYGVFIDLNPRAPLLIFTIRRFQTFM